MTSRSRYHCVPLFGPPGVGKGTQGRMLGRIPGFFHLSVGDVFRSVDIGSVHGPEVHKYISRGEFVPDDLAVSIWRKAVEAYVSLSCFKPGEDLLILDGMPRNVNQVQLIQEDLEIHRVIYLKCSNEDDMVRRIRLRAVQENRTDDADEGIIRRRFDIYREVTAAVLKQYDPAIIFEVDANGSPAEVLRAILECLVPVQNKLFRSNLKPIGDQPQVGAP